MGLRIKGTKRRWDWEEREQGENGTRNEGNRERMGLGIKGTGRGWNWE